MFTVTVETTPHRIKENLITIVQSYFSTYTNTMLVWRLYYASIYFLLIQVDVHLMSFIIVVFEMQSY